MLYVLNTSILTSFGTYSYYEASIDDVKELLSNNEFTSAVGHQATAEFLSLLLGINIMFQRIEISMNVGDIAVVFKLLNRIPEGKILTFDELKNIKYTLGFLKRIE